MCSTLRTIRRRHTSVKPPGGDGPRAVAGVPATVRAPEGRMIFPATGPAARWHDDAVSRSDRIVFRLPAVALVMPVLLFLYITPVADGGPDWLLALYLLPVIGLAYVLVTRTVADGEIIRTIGLLGSHRIAWSDLDGFEFRKGRRAVAVGLDGQRIPLPVVRPRDLPALAQVSGGRLLLGSDAPH